MKKITRPDHRVHIHKILLLALTTISLCSCEKGDKIIDNPTLSFDTEYYEMEFIVEESDRVGYQIFSEDTFSNDLNSLLAMAGFTENDIEEVFLKEAQISILEADTHDDFDILRFFELTLYTDDLGDLKVARLDPVPPGQSILLLDLPEENIYPYFQEGSFMLTAQGYLNERVSGNLKLLAKVKFEIKGRL